MIFRSVGISVDAKKADMSKLWSLGQIRPAGLLNAVRRTLVLCMVKTDVNVFDDDTRPHFP